MSLLHSRIDSGSLASTSKRDACLHYHCSPIIKQGLALQNLLFAGTLEALSQYAGVRIALRTTIAGSKVWNARPCRSSCLGSVNLSEAQLWCMLEVNYWLALLVQGDVGEEKVVNPKGSSVH